MKLTYSEVLELVRAGAGLELGVNSSLFGFYQVQNLVNEATQFKSLIVIDTQVFQFATSELLKLAHMAKGHIFFK